MTPSVRHRAIEVHYYYYYYTSSYNVFMGTGWNFETLDKNEKKNAPINHRHAGSLYKDVCFLGLFLELHDINSYYYSHWHYPTIYIWKIITRIKQYITFKVDSNVWCHEEGDQYRIDSCSGYKLVKRTSTLAGDPSLRGRNWRSCEIILCQVTYHMPKTFLRNHFQA